MNILATRCTTAYVYSPDARRGQGTGHKRRESCDCHQLAGPIETEGTRGRARQQTDIASCLSIVVRQMADVVASTDVRKQWTLLYQPWHAMRPVLRGADGSDREVLYNDDSRLSVKGGNGRRVEAGTTLLSVASGTHALSAKTTRVGGKPGRLGFQHDLHIKRNILDVRNGEKPALGARAARRAVDVVVR
jgi:hypothetical protein